MEKERDFGVVALNQLLGGSALPPMAAAVFPCLFLPAAGVLIAHPMFGWRNVPWTFAPSWSIRGSMELPGHLGHQMHGLWGIVGSNLRPSLVCKKF